MIENSDATLHSKSIAVTLPDGKRREFPAR